MAKAFLVLDDGRIFEGKSWAATGRTFGEAVFQTGMTGYQETLTDPSYHRQVVVMTAPHIGNTGVNTPDNESKKIWVAGFVVRNPSTITSNWRREKDLEVELIEQGIVAIQGIDTRALTRHLRDRGAMRVGIFSDLEISREEMVIEVRKTDAMSGSHLSADVSTPKPYIVPAIGEKRFTVAAIDLGIKGATPRALAARGVEVHVLPFNSTLEDIEKVNPDGVFLSNGPGDPATMDDVVELVRGILLEEIPIFGICFGGKVEITAHNHGFAIKAPTDGVFNTVFGSGEVTHVGLNDGVVEGLQLLERGAFSVQYHPEAAAGPHDAAYLFDRFIDLMVKYPRKVGSI